MDSLTFDVTLATDTVMSFTLTGYFQERDDPAAPHNKPIRHFSRFFVIMKNASGGWNIVNETFFITLPSDEELRVNNKFCHFSCLIVIEDSYD